MYDNNVQKLHEWNKLELFRIDTQNGILKYLFKSVNQAAAAARTEKILKFGKPLKVINTEYSKYKILDM